jgi:hypothetical protein
VTGGKVVTGKETVIRRRPVEGRKSLCKEISFVKYRHSTKQIHRMTKEAYDN